MYASLAWVLIASMALQGCAAGQRYVEKPWGKGTWIPALVCAGAGAAAGWGIQEARVGYSEVVINGDRFRVEDDPQHWIGIVSGALIGGAVCALAGHLFFDPEAPEPPAEKNLDVGLPRPVTKRIVLRGILFDFDRTEIRDDWRGVLDEAVEILRDNPEVRVRVGGHTDAMGSDEYNLALSRRRAEAVFRYLVMGGIFAERLDIEGFGKSRPVAENETEEGRAQNRRVELQVLSSDGESPLEEGSLPSEPEESEVESGEAPADAEETEAPAETPAADEESGQ